MVQIVWTKQAVSDLEEIFEYISKDSVKYARHQILKIRQSTQILKTQPISGRIVPEYGISSVRELVEGNYRIVYALSQNRIDILAVHHGAKNFPRYI